MTRGRMACAGVLLCASVHIPAAHSQDKPEYELKALFFVTLARYTHWPSNTFSSPEQPLIIAVLGQDPFGKKLESLVTRERVQGRPVRVARFSTLEEITECHMIFLTEDNPAQMDLITSRLSRRPILTVSDHRGFAESGGMVELFLNSEGRIRLKVSRSAITKAGLNLTPTLWRMADVVAMHPLLPMTLTLSYDTGSEMVLVATRTSPFGALLR